MDNLNNSEDAAAFAELYQQELKAKQLFNTRKKQFIRVLFKACSEEHDRTDDTGHLEAIMQDLY